ncbi:MAG: P-loop NTPase [Lentisphaerae bacterium]|nr:P-loop NTPase [Lentisphaerota bacterium]
MPEEQAVLDALSQIIDPDFQRDIVSLGFIKEMVIREGHVAFSIELTTPACPIKDRFREEAERLVGAVPGVTKVSVTMTARERPKRQLEEGSGLDKVRTIIAISSCKGGVGKSTVAAMLARNIAARGHKTGLLDTDIFGPSVPTLFNLHQEGVAGQGDYMLPVEADGLKIMSFGFMIGDKPAVMRGPMVSNYLQHLLHHVAWGELDYLVIDLPPGTGDIQLTLSQSIQIDAAVIVTTPHQLSLTDVRKGILMFDKVNVPVIGVIENMAYFICDGCDKRHEIFGGGGAGELEQRFGLKQLAELPISTSMSGSLAAISDSAAAQEATDAVIRAVGAQALARNEKPAVAFDAAQITLTWPDGETVTVANRALRLACACANCVDEMSSRPTLDPDTVPMDIHAKEVWTIGNYAIGVNWSDGHATGFFPYHTLREMVGAPAKARR